MWLSSTKVSSLIAKISDPKDLKKLLRTRNNVLVLYSKSGECPFWPWSRPLWIGCNGVGLDRVGRRGGRGGRQRPWDQNHSGRVQGHQGYQLSSETGVEAQKGVS